MEYYCPKCKREYEDLFFKYCPVCNVRIEKRPYDFTDEITNLKKEINSLNESIKEFEVRLANSSSDEEKVTIRKHLLDSNKKLYQCQSELDLLNKKSLDEEILFKRQKDYENISSLSDETIDSLSTAFKFLNHSDKQDLINLMADSQIDYIQKAIENFKLNNVEKSLEYVNKAIPYCKTEYAWILKSEYHLSLNQYDDAIMCCDNAIKIHPECIVAWYHKAQSYMMLSRYNLSLECGDKILEINDNDYRGWIVKSISYSKQMGKHKESQKCYQKALEVCPNEEVKEEIIAIKKIYKL